MDASLTRSASEPAITGSQLYAGPDLEAASLRRTQSDAVLSTTQAHADELINREREIAAAAAALPGAVNCLFSYFFCSPANMAPIVEAAARAHTFYL